MVGRSLKKKEEKKAFIIVFRVQKMILVQYKFPQVTF